MRQEYIKEWILVMLCSTFFFSVSGQFQPINLEEAIQLASKNYPQLKRDNLSIERYNKLATVGLPAQAMQIYISSEEYNPSLQSGVHSLNFQQNFYLPKASKIQQRYYKQGAEVAEQQANLSLQDLSFQIGQIHYKLLYLKALKTLQRKNIELYTDFLKASKTRFEVGEIGISAQLAAETRLSQALLKQQQNEDAYTINCSLFNQWILSDTLYEPAQELSISKKSASDSTLNDNVHLQLLKAKRDLAINAVDVQEAQLLPQINSGVKLQNSFGVFPLFAFQAGVNVPLFRKSYKGRIDAANIQVKVQEANIAAEQQNLERKQMDLHYRMEQEMKTMDHLQEYLIPLIDKQSTLNQKAYREGIIGYLEYLDSLEQVIKVKRLYVDALYSYNITSLELSYWMSKSSY
jgi:outer membrane protein TolC